MDANTVSVFLSQNRETNSDFVNVLFDNCKREIQELRMENNALRNGNKELQNRIEFCHNQTNDLKKRINALLSKINISHGDGLSDRVMKLGDHARKRTSA